MPNSYRAPPPPPVYQAPPPTVSEIEHSGYPPVTMSRLNPRAPDFSTTNFKPQQLYQQQGGGGGGGAPYQTQNSNLATQHMLSNNNVIFPMGEYKSRKILAEKVIMVAYFYNDFYGY